jgi:hypothetical protein
LLKYELHQKGVFTAKHGTWINKKRGYSLFEYLFARVLASHRRGLGSISSQDMSFSGLLVEDGNDLGQVSP